MFDFFKKNKSPESSSGPASKHYIPSSNPEKLAILSSHFFNDPAIFKKLKHPDTSKKRFVEDNFLNLHYVYGTREDFEDDREYLVNDIKEALNFGWGLKDQATFNELVNSFKIDTLDDAWDIVRLASVTRDAYTVGFVDFKDAKKIIFDLGTQLLRHYDSWEAVARDFLAGKLHFKRLKDLKDADDERFANPSDILKIIDLFFNDPDSPFFKVPLNPNEDLKASSDHILYEAYSLYERAINLCCLYEDMPGWISHWITVDSFYNDLESNFLDFIEENLDLEEDEAFIFAHGKIAENPRDSDFDLILTTQSLFLFPTGDFDEDAYYIDLEDLEANPISFKKGKLYVENELVKESFNFDLKDHADAYAQILNHLIDFIASRA